MAGHLRTEHTELYVSALEVIPRLPDLFDEPFADSSQIPTFLVAGMARRHVTVALSGDGGGELFGGYGYYVSTSRIRHWISNVPAPLRRIQAKAHKLARLAGCRTPEEFHWRRLSHWPDPTAIVLGASEPETVLKQSASWPEASEFPARLMAVDTLSYLPDDLLVKVDRAGDGRASRDACAIP